MDDREVTESIIRMVQLQQKMLNSQLGDVGLHRAQHRLLMNLADGSVESQCDLAKKLEVSPATIAVSLKKLERHGYICRYVHNEDGRYNRISLSSKGMDIVAKSREIFEAVDHECYYGFSNQEKEMFNQYLRKVYHNLKDKMEKDVKE